MALQILYNKDVPNELNTLLEWIDKAYEYLKEKKFIVDWKIDNNTVKSQRNWAEYGFYIFSADKKMYIFVGLWFEIWREYNQPLCFSIPYIENPKSKIKLVSSLEQLLSEKQSIYDRIIDYENHATITLKQSFLCGIGDYKSIVSRVLDIAEAVDLKLINE